MVGVINHRWQSRGTPSPVISRYSPRNFLSTPDLRRLSCDASGMSGGNWRVPPRRAACPRPPVVLPAPHSRAGRQKIRPVPAAGTVGSAPRALLGHRQHLRPSRRNRRDRRGDLRLRPRGGADDAAAMTDAAGMARADAGRRAAAARSVITRENRRPIHQSGQNSGRSPGSGRPILNPRRAIASSSSSCYVSLIVECR